MGTRDGHYDGPDATTVRLREIGTDRDGADRSEWHGTWPPKRARAVADRLARERGGRIVEDGHVLRVIVGSSTGRPAVGPMVSHRMPKDLIDRLDARARATGTTRSELLRRGAELVLADGDD